MYVSGKKCLTLSIYRILIYFIRITFQQLELQGTASLFWQSMGVSLISAASKSILKDLINPMSSSADFIANFYAYRLSDTPVVLLIDELSELTRAQNNITEEFLGACRAIRDNPSSAVRSTIGAGTFSVLNLNPAHPSLSPFNVASSISVAYFSLEQCFRLFQEFAEEITVTIPDTIVTDIWALSNGSVRSHEFGCI